ncbi:AMP-binding protein [Streptomyces sp. SCUT-3]|nr:AMP-binding protein [Streptomyces sp. SCUT-3]
MDLSTLLAHQLGGRGSRVALESGARTWSYADLDRVTRDRAAQLRALYPEAVRVVLAGEHTAEALVWALAVMRAGLVYTPLNPDCPRNGSARPYGWPDPTWWSAARPAPCASRTSGGR